MAIDFEKEALEFRQHRSLTGHVSSIPAILNNDVEWLRHFAAKVLRDVKLDPVYITAVLNGECCSELERRAAEIEKVGGGIF